MKFILNKQAVLFSCAHILPPDYMTEQFWAPSRFDRTLGNPAASCERKVTKTCKPARPTNDLATSLVSYHPHFSYKFNCYNFSGGLLNSAQFRNYPVWTTLATVHYSFHTVNMCENGVMRVNGTLCKMSSCSAVVSIPKTFIKNGSGEAIGNSRYDSAKIEVTC